MLFERHQVRILNQAQKIDEDQIKETIETRKLPRI